MHLFSGENLASIVFFVFHLIMVYWLRQQPANREDHGSIPGGVLHCQLIFRCGVSSDCAFIHGGKCDVHNTVFKRSVYQAVHDVVARATARCKGFLGSNFSIFFYV